MTRRDRPGSALEFRLERVNDLTNSCLQDAQRLYDRRPVFERYACGEFDLHLHPTCWRRLYSKPSSFVHQSVRPCISLHSLMGGNKNGSGHDAESRTVVFIVVGELPELAKPQPSEVRLQPLNRCGVLGAHTFEIDLSSPREPIGSVLDRKLSSRRSFPGVKDRQLADQVVQRRSQVTDDVPDNEWEIVRRLGKQDPQDVLAAFDIALLGDSIWVRCLNDSDLVFERVKVLFGPSELEMAGV